MSEEHKIQIPGPVPEKESRPLQTIHLYQDARTSSRTERYCDKNLLQVPDLAVKTAKYLCRERVKYQDIPTCIQERGVLSSMAPALPRFPGLSMNTPAQPRSCLLSGHQRPSTKFLPRPARL